MANSKPSLTRSVATSEKESKSGGRNVKKDVKVYIVDFLQFLWSFCKQAAYVPGDTYRFIFQKNPEVYHSYVYYRIAITLAHGTLLVISMFNLFIPCKPTRMAICISGGSRVCLPWLFYLTSWGIILNFTQSFIGLILTMRAYLDQRSCKLRNTVPKFLKAKNEHKLRTITGVYWGLNSTSTALSIIIDLVYWGYLYDYSKKVELTIINALSEHAFNFLFMIIDKCMVAFPAMATHVLLIPLMSLLYLMTSVIYYEAGGLDQDQKHDYLYAFLNWHNPSKAIVFSLILTGFAIFLVITFMIADTYKLEKLRPQQIRAAYKEMMAKYNDKLSESV